MLVLLLKIKHSKSSSVASDHLETQQDLHRSCPIGDLNNFSVPRSASIRADCPNLLPAAPVTSLSRYTQHYKT